MTATRTARQATHAGERLRQTILSCTHNNSRTGRKSRTIPLSSLSMAKGAVRCRWPDASRRASVGRQAGALLRSERLIQINVFLRAARNYRSSAFFQRARHMTLRAARPCSRAAFLLCQPSRTESWSHGRAADLGERIQMVQEIGLMEDGSQHEVDFLSLNALNISHFAAESRYSQLCVRVLT